MQRPRVYHLTLILFIILTTAVAHAQQGPQAVFDEANNLLAQGQINQAISQYQQLENQQKLAGALFLNLGIAYQRIDSLGKAKYYYLKSAKFPETREQAQEALKYVNTQFSHQSAVLPQLPWDRATRWLQDNIGETRLLAIGLILFNLGILLFIATWFFRELPGLIKPLSFSVLGLTVIIIAAAFYTRYVNNRYSTAVMVTQEAVVAERPLEEAALVSRAFEGYTFTVDHKRSKTQPKWSYVRMSNGLYGWIPSKEILVL